MEEKKLTEVSYGELPEKSKKTKSTQMMNAVIFGVIVGITVYSTVKNGFNLLTVLLLFFAVIAFNNWRVKKQSREIWNDR